MDEQDTWATEDQPEIAAQAGGNLDELASDGPSKERAPLPRTLIGLVLSFHRLTSVAIAYAVVVLLLLSLWLLGALASVSWILQIATGLVVFVSVIACALFT